MKKEVIAKSISISLLFMQISCAYNKGENAMSIDCKEAYDNLYKSYDNNSFGSSGTENAVSLLFMASDNYAQKEEYNRLERECN